MPQYGGVQGNLRIAVLSIGLICSGVDIRLQEARRELSVEFVTILYSRREASLFFVAAKPTADGAYPGHRTMRLAYLATVGASRPGADSMTAAVTAIRHFATIRRSNDTFVIHRGLVDLSA